MMIVKFKSKPNKQYIGKVKSVCGLYDSQLQKFVYWYHIQPLFHRGTWTVSQHAIVKVYR